MVKRLKKYERGTSAQFYTRQMALRKLQLSLKDFRRLCILKGIYPREPSNRRKAQRGNTDIKILYHKKDIQFLLHEPIVWTLRDIKIMNRRIKYSANIKDKRMRKLRQENYPTVKMDHIVKERYPTFIDAIKDLDDCLTLLFLFSTFPALKVVRRSLTAMCRRLTVEFMHFVIASKALRKVFVSIKGYYFQAEIKGQLVTWIVPHYYPYQPQQKNAVDFSIMAVFVEFYTILAGFTNFRLYHSINMLYPPQFATALDSNESQESEEVFVSERIAALTHDLAKVNNDEGNYEDEDGTEDIDLGLMENESERVQLMRDDAVSLRRLKSLFKGLKIFINREVPREPLVFIIRCFGGKVSWDRTLFVGASFDEDDESITHHIVDRDSLEKQYISRDYVQPQWVFDCVNQRQLLPTNNYFMGAVLPPHLSPFVDPNRDESTYIPPEEKALRDPKLIETHEYSDEDMSDNEAIAEKEEKEDDQVALDYELEQAYKEDEALSKIDDEEMGISKPKKGKSETKLASAKPTEKEAEEENEDEDEEEEDEDDNEDAADKKDKLRELERQKMAVKQGEVFVENKSKTKRQNQAEQKLRSRMIKSRHRNIYHILKQARDKQGKEARLLEKKRIRIEGEKKVAKKEQKVDGKKAPAKKAQA